MEHIKTEYQFLSHCMTQIRRFCRLMQGPINFKIPHWFIISYKPKFGDISLLWKPRTIMNVSDIFLCNQIPLSLSVIFRLSVFNNESFFYLILRVTIYIVHMMTHRNDLCARRF